MKKFLILLAQTHEVFRIPELEALASIKGIKTDFGGHKNDSPFLVVELESCEQAKQLVKDSILCKAVYELYGSGNSLEEVHADVKSGFDSGEWAKYENDSFKFDIITYQGSRSKEEQVKMIESFAYMALKGPIRMKNSQQTFAILEDWHPEIEHPTHPDHIWFARYLCDSSRKIVDKYDLKKRKYIGTTSFEAELALVTCNIAQLSPGKLMYDPFAGTGSFLVCGAEFGALTVGSDIDVRMIKGKGKATISANFRQYGLDPLFLDVMTMDFTHNAFRSNLKFDAIVCDPPYGVREGLKVLGSKNERFTKEHIPIMEDGTPCHLKPDYIHPKKPYQFGSLLDDLLQFASDHLVEHGRLCFWMPTASDSYQETDIPLHTDLTLIANCEQEFNKWSRRLLVYTRRAYGDKGESYSVKDKSNEEFREKYFRGFKDS